MPTVTVIQPTITEEKNTVLRCAAYCRVSSDSEDQLNSLMAQTRYYGKFFENSETEILVDIYADEGVTGTREDKREEFQRMMKDCHRGRIDRIYTKSISRLHLQFPMRHLRKSFVHRIFRKATISDIVQECGL